MTSAVATAAVESVEYTISAESLGWFADRFAKIERRAARAGIAGQISWSEVSREQREREDGLGSDTFVTIRVSGESPSFGGWTLAATLAHAGEAGTIIRSVPSFDGRIPVQYRTATSETCDHCRSRRARLDTFLVANEETGEWRQVGRNCIANFLGLGDPHALVVLAEIWGNLALDLEGREEQDRSGGMSIPEQINLDAALEYAAESVIRSGWVSRKMAHETNERIATADRVLEAMFGKNVCRTGWKDACRQPCETHFTPSEQAVTMAAAALEWAPEWLASEQARADRDGVEISDYAHNMRVVLNGSTVTKRSLALGVSLISIWRRAQERQERERRERENAAPSSWVGTEGERLTLTLTVQTVREFPGDFGTRTLITYHDQEGNVVKWWATGFHNPEIGSTVTVDATVTKHDEYKGRKETTVSRVKPFVSKDAKKALAAARKAKRAEIAAAQAVADAAQADVDAAMAAAPHFEDDDEYQGLAAAYEGCEGDANDARDALYQRMGLKAAEGEYSRLSEAARTITPRYGDEYDAAYRAVNEAWATKNAVYKAATDAIDTDPDYRTAIDTREALYTAMQARREAVGARWAQPEVLAANARLQDAYAEVRRIERELYDLGK